MGSGSTAIAALKSDRYFVGYDISEEYVQIAERRIKEETAQLNLLAWDNQQNVAET